MCTKDRLLANIGVLGYTTKTQGGILLRDHINDNATINDNASACHPNNTSALLKLVSSLIEAKKRQPRNEHQGPPPEDRTEEKPADDNEENKGPKREGVQFAQTEVAPKTAPTE